MSNEYKFRCKDCKIDFSVESDSGNVNLLNKELKRGVRCPKCDSQWGEKDSKIDLQLQIGADRNGHKSLESRRKENSDRTKMAAQQAGEYTKSHPQEKMISVKGKPQSKFGRTVEQIPERLIKSIEDKLVIPK